MLPDPGQGHRPGWADPAGPAAMEPARLASCGFLALRRCGHGRY